MGSCGSGRWQNGRLTTTDMRALDIRQFHREDVPAPGRAFDWHWKINGDEVSSIQMKTESDCVVLTYRCRRDGGDWEPMEYPVSIESTNCNLGGRRPWFLYPAQGCRRRVAILYGGTIFACRRCHRLTYASQRERADERATRRADTIRDRLKRERGILNPAGDTPKRMHRRTFDRLKAQHNAWVEVPAAGVVRQFGPIDGIGGIEEVLHGS